MHQPLTTYSQLTKSDQTNPLPTKKTPPQSTQPLCPSVPPVVKDSCAASSMSDKDAASSRTRALSPARGGISPASRSIAEALSSPTKTHKTSAQSASSAEKKLNPADAGLQAIRARIKSLVLKNLFTNPVFARFYVDLVIRNSPNSNAARIFRHNYKKILDRISNMPQTNSCTHIKVSGVRCGSPALRGEQFCYFHQQAHRSVRRPPFSRLHPIAIIEDEDSIQASLMEVINGLVRNTLDIKRATLIIRALHIAVKNASRVRLASQVEKKVREIPEYAMPPEETLDPITNEGGRAVLDEEAELPAVAAKEPHEIDPQDPHWEERLEDGGRILARRAAAAKCGPDRCGARAPARPTVGTGAFARSGSAATALSANIPTNPNSKATQRKPPNGVYPETPRSSSSA